MAPHPHPHPRLTTTLLGRVGSAPLYLFPISTLNSSAIIITTSPSTSTSAITEIDLSQPEAASMATPPSTKAITIIIVISITSGLIGTALIVAWARRSHAKASAKNPRHLERIDGKTRGVYKKNGFVAAPVDGVEGTRVPDHQPGGPGNGQPDPLPAAAAAPAPSDPIAASGN